MLTDPDTAFALRLRFMKGNNIALGPGKIDLLHAINKYGSISKAARAMEMSYKRAWSLTDTMNQSFQTPLVETSRGGQRGGGASLTPLGQTVLTQYRLIENKMTACAKPQIDKILSLLDVNR